MKPRNVVNVLLATALGLSLVGCTEDSSSCTSLGISREMIYEAAIPQAVDAATSTFELCIGQACDISRLVASPQSNVMVCEDVDTNTKTFPTTCSFAQVERTVTLKTNTVYGGHAGTDELVLTAVSASGARTELLHGTVTYTDTTDDAARGACTDAWQGTFTKRIPPP